MNFDRIGQHLRHPWVLAVFAAGLALTALAYSVSAGWIERNLQEEFGRISRRTAASLQQQIDLHQEALRGMQGLFIASDEVTRADFRAYVKLLNLQARYPGVLNFRLARHVMAREAPAWRARVARELAALDGQEPMLSVPAATAEEDEQLLVEYIHPFESNRRYIGLDLMADPGRRAAIARTRLTLQPALSGRLGEFSEPTYVLIAALPPRAGNSFPGTIALLLRPQEMLSAQITRLVDAGIDVELYDTAVAAEIGRGTLISDSSGAANDLHTSGPQRLQSRQPLRLGDREWTLVVTALPAWGKNSPDYWVPPIVGAGGLVTSLLLALLVAGLLAGRQRAETVAQFMQSDLLRAQAVAHIGSWHLDGATGALSWSPEMFRLFGLPPDMPVDYQRFLAYVHPDDRAAVEAAWQAALRGEPYLIAHRILVDGEVRWMEERAELEFDSAGQLRVAHGTVQDITEIKAREQALRDLNTRFEAMVVERTARLHAILEHMQDVVIVADEHGIIQMANPALARLLGYAPESVADQNVSLLMPEPDKSAHDSYLARYLGGGEAHVIGKGREVLARHQSGESIPVFLQVSEFQVEGVRYFLGTLHDVREYKRLLAELQRSVEMRQEFLATMSHEIRTPLTGMMGMLELLSFSALSKEQRHELAVARDSGQALTRIIDDILDFSKIEAGRLQLSPQPEDLRALVEGVRDAQLAVASAKGISLMSFVDPRLPQRLVMDGLRVQQILHNFVSNAIKFTVEGYVELRAEWLGTDDDVTTFRLTVRDSGIGIPPEVREKLFERYIQGDATVARRYGGTGLGLAICRKLVELMNGTIGLESEPGQGSAFHVTLTLPVAPDAVERPEPQANGTLVQIGNDGRPVLVADDHPTNRALIARQMELLGLSLELAENGNQALAKWRHGDYCLILTDCHMPVMDGFELARAVRELEVQEDRARTPIIAWTAAALPEEVARCQAVGMDDVLLKPTELAALRRMLARWLPFMPARAVAPGAADENAILDRGILAQLTDSAEEEQIILRDFLEQTVLDLARLNEAVTAGDMADGARQAHRIKGAARMVGAATIATRAGRAEEAARTGDAGAMRARLAEIETDLAELGRKTGIALHVSAGGELPVWDAGVLRDMVGDSPQLHRELLDSFFDSSSELRQALSASYEKREARNLARCAHKFKSAAAAIGARELAAQLKEIEAAANNGDWPLASEVHNDIEAAWQRLAALHGREST